MSEIVLVTWDGGGNVAVKVAIAEALRSRGHGVTVAGPRSLRSEVEPLAVGFAELGIAPPPDPRQRLGYLLDVTQGSDAMFDELRRLAERADVLAVDCNLSWALRSRISDRTAVLVHTALGIYLPVWQAVLDMANQQRSARGLPPLAAAADAWAWPDLLLVASLAHYSTDSLQNSPRRLQTALDALAGLPVTVLATTSGAFAAARLRVPANATVVDYLPHDTVIATVALLVCHAGHGTTMAALTHGVPLVCVPGLGRDQQPIATRVSELGLGIALRGDATAPAIRNAVTTVLADHSYLDRAREFAQRTGQRADGAQRGATELLAMLDGPSKA